MAEPQPPLRPETGVPLVPAPRPRPSVPRGGTSPRRAAISIEFGISIRGLGPLFPALREAFRRRRPTGTPGIGGALPPDLPFAPPVPEPVPVIPRVRPPVRVPVGVFEGVGPQRFGFGLPGIIGIVLTEFGQAVLDRLLKRQSDRMIAEAEAEIDILRRRQRARARERQVLTLPPVPQLPESPADREMDVIDVVARPVFTTRPEPGVRAEPLEIPFEVPVPTIRPVFTPVPAPTAPAPTTRPGRRVTVRPIVLPALPTLPLPLGVPSPVQLPLPQPLPVPLPTPGVRAIPLGIPSSLTGPQATPLQFAEPRSQTDPQSRQSRCEQVCEKKKRRNRQRCWKGLYAESTSRTKFTKWQRIDCRTGREIN